MYRSIGKTGFEIFIGMKPRGVLDLMDIVVDEEKRSVEGEVFADFMKSLHE